MLSKIYIFVLQGQNSIDCCHSLPIFFLNTKGKPSLMFTLNIFPPSYYALGCLNSRWGGTFKQNKGVGREQAGQKYIPRNIIILSFCVSTFSSFSYKWRHVNIFQKRMPILIKIHSDGQYQDLSFDTTFYITDKKPTKI